MIPAEKLAEARAELVRSAPLMRMVYEGAIRQGTQAVRPVGSPAQAAGKLADREIARVQAASLYFVQPALARHCNEVAERSIPTAIIRPELPSDFGLVYFAVPLALNDQESESDLVPRVGQANVRSEVVLCAASWGVWPDAPAQWPDGGLWVTWYSDLDLSLMADIETGRLSAEQAETARRASPTLVLDNETQIPFSDEPVGATEDNLYGRCWRALRELFATIARGDATVSELRPDRAARRRAERGTGPVDATVRVLDLASAR